MFTNLYLGEIKKLVRPKGLLILAAIIIVFLIIYGIAYDFMVDISQNNGEINTQEQEPIGIFGSMYKKKVYDQESVQTLIFQTQTIIKELEQSQDNDDILSRLDYDRLYEMKGYLKALEHIEQNELYNQEIEIFSPNALFGVERSAEGFMQGFITMLLSIMLIYGVVLGSVSYAQEMDEGTLKMVFIRPITRNKLTTAKLFALITVACSVFLVAALLAFLYALLRYGSSVDVHTVLIVFNALSVFTGTNSLALFIVILFSLLQLIAMVILGFALGTLIRKKTIAIIIGVIINLGVLSSIFSLLKMGRFLFTTSSDLGMYFGVTPMIPAGGNFFLSLSLLLVYLGIFLTATYVSFNKRDIS